MVSLQLPKLARKEKPRLFYGMYLFIKIIIQQCLYAAFCHAICSWNKWITESLTFCKIFSYYKFLFQLVFTPDFDQRHIPRYKYIKWQQQKNPRGVNKNNDPWTRRTCWMKELRNPFVSHRWLKFWHKNQVPDLTSVVRFLHLGQPSFWVKFLTVRS